MRLPIQAQPVMRNVSTGKLVDQSAVLPSWPPKIKIRVPKPSDFSPCRIRCRAVQAAETSACSGSGPAFALCAAAAQLKGEKCVTSC
jgi:hypothetical protein